MAWMRGADLQDEPAPLPQPSTPLQRPDDPKAPRHGTNATRLPGKDPGAPNVVTNPKEPAKDPGKDPGRKDPPY